MPVVHFHLFGEIALDDAANLQRRLAYEAASRGDGRTIVMLCEHPLQISIGRSGSRSNVRLDIDELARRNLEIEYVARGGGTILHEPGQLACYVVAPIVRLGWTVGGYMQRLQSGVSSAVESLGVRTETRSQRFGLWGRSGLLAAFGISVRYGIATQGVWLSVEPATKLGSRVVAAAGDRQPHFGSLSSERPAGGRMAAVRSAMVNSLATAFDCENYQLHSGHPLLPDALPIRELAQPA